MRSRPDRPRPGALGSNAVVAEQGDAHAVAHENGRLARRFQIDPAPACLMPASSSPCERVGDAAFAAIRDVIAGKRDGVEAGASQRRQVRGIRARGGDVALQLARATAVRHFEMADREIRSVQGGRDAATASDPDPAHRARDRPRKSGPWRAVLRLRHSLHLHAEFTGPG